MEKQKLDPEYDEKYKKQVIQNKVRYDAKKKQQILEKDIFLYWMKSNNSERIEMDSGDMKQDSWKASFKRYWLGHHWWVIEYG